MGGNTDPAHTAARGALPGFWRVAGTGVGTSAALNTDVLINNIFIISRRYAGYGTFRLTRAAADTFLCNIVCHLCAHSFLFIGCIVLRYQLKCKWRTLLFLLNNYY
jgi:hypothetical protein